MSVSVTIHLSDGFTTEGQLNEFDARPCNLAWLSLRQSDVCIVSLMFDEPAQVDTLVAALVRLRDDFAAARPDPAVVPLCEPTPIDVPPTDELPIRLTAAEGPCLNCQAEDQSPSRTDGLCAECGLVADEIQF